MIRWLYIRLIRLHPDRFRQRFGEEMMSIFDESARQRSGWHLVIDAFVSMLRQWVLRSRYRSGPERRSLAVGMSSLAEFHARSERVEKNARRLNWVWILGALPLHLLVAAVVNPRNRTVTAEFTYTVLPVFILLALCSIFSRGFAGDTEGSLSIRNTRNSRRNELERKWDCFRLWSDYMGPVLALSALAWVSPAVLAYFLGKTPMARSWASVNFIVFGIQAVLFFAIVKRLNARAALALQQEIEAIDANSGERGT